MAGEGFFRPLFILTFSSRSFSLLFFFVSDGFFFGMPAWNSYSSIAWFGGGVSVLNSASASMNSITPKGCLRSSTTFNVADINRAAKRRYCPCDGVVDAYVPCSQCSPVGTFAGGRGDVSTFSLHPLLKLVTGETGKHKSVAQFLFLFLLPGMTCAGGRRLRTNTGTRASLGDRSTSEK